MPISRLDTAEKVSDLEDKSIEITQIKAQKKKRVKKRASKSCRINVKWSNKLNDRIQTTGSRSSENIK